MDAEHLEESAADEQELHGPRDGVHGQSVGATLWAEPTADRHRVHVGEHAARVVANLAELGPENRGSNWLAPRGNARNVSA